MNEWSDYYKVVGACPNTQVARAVSAYQGPRRQALDLGAGNLRDAYHLLYSGFESVTAVDRESMPEAPNVTRLQTQLEQYMPMPNTYDIAICCNVLFFIGKEDAVKILTRAFNALTSEGVLVFNLLGDTDEWVIKGQHQVVGYSVKELTSLLSGFAKKKPERSRGRFPDASGREKYWDIWKVSVQKS